MRVFRFGYPWMIVWAIGIHINTGIFMLINPMVASLLPFIGLREFDKIGLTVPTLAISLILIGTLALWGILNEDKYSAKKTLIFLLPQYGLMIAAILSDSRLLIVGVKSASGSTIPFTIAEPLTFLIMFAAILHTLSILERFVLGPRRG